MILHQCEIVGQGDISKFMWNGLRRFHNIPLVTSIITQRHSVHKKYIDKVQKQSRQIRQCLMQAREYRDAASVVSLATKPLLLYYSAMSLALAQILLKSDGDSSLDRARGEHAHHGLVFSAGSAPKNHLSLGHAASELRARPMISAEGQRRGTFELWQRTSREDPIGGYVTRRRPDGSQTGFNGLMRGADHRFGTLKPTGLSLLDCFQALPGMMEATNADEVGSKVVRGKVAVDVNQDGLEILSITVHPARQELLDFLANSIVLPPKDFESVSIITMNNAIVFRVSQDKFSKVDIRIPPSTTWSENEVRFLPPDTQLNEFGHIYAGLYMLGNYARYFPDRWVDDVESGSPLAHASEIFLDMAERRIALLTYSDFLGRYCVLRD